MNDEEDKQRIREVIDNWLRASKDGDLETVLSLMAEDVVFLRPGCEPMRGREGFAAASRGMAGKMHIEGKAEIQEIVINGNYAYCWNFLSMTITPTGGGEAMNHSGHILSVFRREPDGKWVLWRDANMLTAAGSKQ
jgi:uncharacterized protein (TIGR02246 family)